MFARSADTAMYVDLLDAEGFGYSEWVESAFEPFGSGLLILDRIRIEPEHRGHGYGFYAAQLMMLAPSLKPRTSQSRTYSHRLSLAIWRHGGTSKKGLRVAIAEKFLALLEHVPGIEPESYDRL